jgi:hypothetical protein
MSKKNRFLAVAAVCVLVAGAASVYLPAQLGRLCCINGKYEGWQVNDLKPNCPRPVKEAFTMTISQQRGCGAGLKGTVIDSAGTVNNWTGTLAPGLRGCCRLEGKFLTPGGNTVIFMGTICRNAVTGKWQAKGTWEEIGSTDPCRGKGTWQMKQI